MFHEQMISFLEAAVVFLLMTNVISMLATLSAIRMVKVLAPTPREPAGVVQRKIESILRRAG